MAFIERDLDITRNIRLIEWLKSEILGDISSLFRILVNGFKEEVRENVSETLANIILMAYILGRRLGTSYSAIEIKIENKLRLGIIEQNEVEKFYGDLSSLSKHLGEFRHRKG